MSTTPRGKVIIAAGGKAPVISTTGNPKAPISIADGRERVKRAKLTGVEFKAARAQAIAVTGYDSTSPIYGKQLPEVIAMIEDAIAAAGASTQSITVATGLLQALKARALTRKLIGQARA